MRGGKSMIENRECRDFIVVRLIGPNDHRSLLPYCLGHASLTDGRFNLNHAKALIPRLNPRFDRFSVPVDHRYDPGATQVPPHGHGSIGCCPPALGHAGAGDLPMPTTDASMIRSNVTALLNSAATGRM